MESEIELVLNDMKDKLETTDNETKNEKGEKGTTEDISEDISEEEQENHDIIKKHVSISIDKNIEETTTEDNEQLYDYTPRYISDYDSSLKQNKLEDLLTYDNFFDLIEPFPKITEIEDLTHMTELKSWLYNSLDRYYQKGKYKIISIKKINKKILNIFNGPYCGVKIDHNISESYHINFKLS